MGKKGKKKKKIQYFKADTLSFWCDTITWVALTPNTARFSLSRPTAGFFFYFWERCAQNDKTDKSEGGNHWESRPCITQAPKQINSSARSLPFESHQSASYSESRTVKWQNQGQQTGPRSWDFRLPNNSYSANPITNPLAGVFGGF